MFTIESHTIELCNSNRFKENSLQFSASEGRPNLYRRENFLSSLKKIRNLSNQSIRDIPENDRRNSSITAGYSVTNLIQGIGILGVPFAIVKGSWMGAIMLIITAIIGCSTGKMIIDCLYENIQPGGKTRVRKSYSCIGEAVWPRFGKSLLGILSFIEIFGGTTLYIILMSVESKNLISLIYPDFSIYYCSLILTYLVLPLTFITRMSIVSWFSFVAVIGLLSTIITIIVYCFYNISYISLVNFPSITWTTVPLSLGIITFSYCAHAAFPGIEACMKNPSSFNKMMNVSFTFAAIVKFSMSILFVLIFGTNTYQQCSLNVQNIYFRILLEIVIILNTFFSIPLTTFIITEQIDDTFQHYFHPSLWAGGRYYLCWLFLSRTIVLTASMFCAMMVPHFALLMGLIGSVTGSCLTFIFPCFFSLYLKAQDLSLIQKVYRIILIVIGIALGISGAIVSMIEIINTFNV